MKAARERGQRRPINRPCSACGDGDTEMRDHLHYPPFADEAAVGPSCTLCGAGMILVYKCRSCGSTSDLNEIPSGVSTAATGAATDSAGQSGTRVLPADQSSGAAWREKEPESDAPEYCFAPSPSTSAPGAGPQGAREWLKKVRSMCGWDIGRAVDKLLCESDLDTMAGILDAYTAGVEAELARAEAERDDLRDANRRLAESLEQCQGQNSLLIAGRNELEAELARVKAERDVVIENLADYARRGYEGWDMYMNAWLREMGGVIRHKRHQIDGFVLRMRDIYEKAKLVDRIKEIMVKEVKREGATKDTLFDEVLKYLAENGKYKVPTN